MEIRYNPRNVPINNSKFDSVEEEEEEKFEDPMAKFLENKEKTMNKKRTINDNHHHKHSSNRNNKQAKTSDSYSEILIILVYDNIYKRILIFIEIFI